MANANSLRKTTLGKGGGSAKEHNLSRQMSSLSSSGTFVNREETSKEHIVPLPCLYFFGPNVPLEETLDQCRSGTYSRPQDPSHAFEFDENDQVSSILFNPSLRVSLCPLSSAFSLNVYACFFCFINAPVKTEP